MAYPVQFWTCGAHSNAQHQYADQTNAFGNYSQNAWPMPGYNGASEVAGCATDDIVGIVAVVRSSNMRYSCQVMLD